MDWRRGAENAALIAPNGVDRSHRMGCGPRMRMELPAEAWSVPLCRHVMLAVLHDRAVDAERVADIELVLSETTGNVIRHAYDHSGQHYRVALEVFADRICFQVEDEGRGF